MTACLVGQDVEARRRQRLRRRAQPRSAISTWPGSSTSTYTVAAWPASIFWAPGWEAKKRRTTGAGRGSGPGCRGDGLVSRSSSASRAGTAPTLSSHARTDTDAATAARPRTIANSSRARRKARIPPIIKAASASADISGDGPAPRVGLAGAFGVLRRRWVDPWRRPRSPSTLACSTPPDHRLLARGQAPGFPGYGRHGRKRRWARPQGAPRSSRRPAPAARRGARLHGREDPLAGHLQPRRVRGWQRCTSTGARAACSRSRRGRRLTSRLRASGSTRRAAAPARC